MKPQFTLFSILTDTRYIYLTVIKRKETAPPSFFLFTSFIIGNEMIGIYVAILLILEFFAKPAALIQ